MALVDDMNSQLETKERVLNIDETKTKPRNRWNLHLSFVMPNKRPTMSLDNRQQIRLGERAG